MSRLAKWRRGKRWEFRRVVQHNEEDGDGIAGELPICIETAFSDEADTALFQARANMSASSDASRCSVVWFAPSFRVLSGRQGLLMVASLDGAISGAPAAPVEGLGRGAGDEGRAVGMCVWEDTGEAGAARIRLVESGGDGGRQAIGQRLQLPIFEVLPSCTRGCTDHVDPDSGRTDVRSQFHLTAAGRLRPQSSAAQGLRRTGRCESCSEKLRMVPYSGSKLLLT